jgi:hypothetical protein
MVIDTYAKISQTISERANLVCSENLLLDRAEVLARLCLRWKCSDRWRSVSLDAGDGLVWPCSANPSRRAGGAI